MSFFLPLRRSWIERVGYIWVGMILPIVSMAFDVNLDLFLYLYIAKSCFLLSRKEVITNAVFFGLFNTFTGYWIFPSAIDHLEKLGFGVTQPLQIAFNYGAGYAGGAAFVILAVFAILAERSSRHRAEQLAGQVEQLAADLERARIARDLHDSIGHTLTNLDVQLAVAQKWRDRDPQKVNGAIDTAKGLAHQCIGDIDQALRTMRQPEFDLNQALIILIEQMKQQQSWRIQWEIDLPSLPLQASHQIYCIIKEGLMNIQCHAQASKVWLKGEMTVNGILLEVQDDGQGFEMTQPLQGFGLKGIAERVQLLGGKLTIDSAVDQGTKLTVILPSHD